MPHRSLKLTGDPTVVSGMAHRVLVADDDVIARMILHRALGSAGYDVTVARDGIEAWRLVQAAPGPGIYLLDWAMPGIDGVELCRRIREDPSRHASYIALLTGKDAEDDVVRGFEAGADDYLTKPVRMRELAARLRAGLRGRGLDAAATPPRSTPSRDGSPAPLRSVPSPSSGGDGTKRIGGGKYVLKGLVGSGGMGIVWRAQHVALGTPVAIKLIRPAYARDRESVRRFRIEAQAAARLDTPHVVRVYDYSEDDPPFIAMELLTGSSLADVIDRRGPLPAREVVRIVSQVARGLSAAHGAGIVHRDLKPENIFLATTTDSPPDEPLVKILDFGVAKLLGAPAVGPTTQAGHVLGTPAFMAPETLTGETPAGPATDLWALACSTFAAMTGNDPFEGGRIGDLVLQICVRPLPVPSEVHPGVARGFDAWFARACARDPQQRFQSASELADALRDACASTSSLRPRPCHTAPSSP